MHLDHGFVAQVAGGGEGRGAGGLEAGIGTGQFRIDGDLHTAAAVAQVDEDDAAVVAAAVHPATELDRLAGVVGT